MNIVVLCGGISTEREVSLWSAEKICSALRKKGHKAILLDVFLGRNDINENNAFENLKSVSEELEIIKEAGKDIEYLKKNRAEFFGENVIEICKKCDAVFMGLHGENGENGKVQAAFDLFGIKYTGNDYIGNAMAMSKAVTRMLFKANNVPMAKGTAVTFGEDINSAKEVGLDYPVVIKPSCGGSSIGVFFANDDAEFKRNTKAAFEYEHELVIEEKIVGREFSCGVISCEALPVIEIIPKTGTYDFNNKYSKDATEHICPANISDELKNKIQTAAKMAAKALGLNTYCRVDVLTDEDENCYCLEANTLPGMTETSLLPLEAMAVGIDFPSLCEKLIDISMKVRQKY